MNVMPEERERVVEARGGRATPGSPRTQAASSWARFLREREWGETQPTAPRCWRDEEGL